MLLSLLDLLLWIIGGSCNLVVILFDVGSYKMQVILHTRLKLVFRPLSR